VISWIPISVAFSKTIQAVIHFVGQQLYASDIRSWFFSKERIFGAIRAKVISVSNK
jgi:hypothetical protein